MSLPTASCSCGRNFTSTKRSLPQCEHGNGAGTKQSRFGSSTCTRSLARITTGERLHLRHLSDSSSPCAAASASR